MKMKTVKKIFKWAAISFGALIALFIIIGITADPVEETAKEPAKEVKAVQKEEKAEDKVAKEKEAAAAAAKKKEAEEKAAAEKAAADKAKKEAEAKAAAEKAAAEKVLAAEQKYLTALQPVWQDTPEYFYNISELSTKAGKNPSLFFDNDWKIDVVMEFEGLMAALQPIRDTEAPPAFTDMHALLLKAVDEYEQSKEKYYHGVDNMDADAITQAGQHMTQGSQYIKQATGLMEEYNKSRGN